MAFRGVDLARRCRRVENPQQREPEAGRVEAAQLDVAAVAVSVRTAEILENPSTDWLIGKFRLPLHWRLTLQLPGPGRRALLGW